MTEPSSALTTPVAEDPVPNLLENALDGSLTSPTYLVGEAMVFCGMVGSNDPWAFISDRLAGDWQAVQTAGKSLEGLAEFSTSMAEELSTAKSSAMNSWKGEAADEAERYFLELGKVLESQSPVIRKMAKQLDQTSFGLYEASESIKDLVGDLIDWLVIVGIKATAALFAGGSGAGAPAAVAFLAAALLAAKSAWNIVDKIHEIMNYAWAGAQATVGLISGHLATVKDTPLPALPTSAYQFEGA
ncbi:hypothetical protein BFN03_03235 [Rhodococcus sp. WMMA185]|uniref:hypothetical protein n=1 Tax=Rhodococcus sp. WMMA185 TaxID=679318 RepID=UPI000878CCFA|nr:hypothetical protein [Rhodococcus sp. WMMA185]AOW92045.1 hypothetical protein BFN03_03235 [Rhodococcus sp. WMMA185]